MRVIEKQVLTTVVVPFPEQVAADVMAIHHVLDLLITDYFPPGQPVNGRDANCMLPLLQNLSEQARRAACNIDHLARGC